MVEEETSQIERDCLCGSNKKFQGYPLIFIRYFSFIFVKMLMVDTVYEEGTYISVKNVFWTENPCKFV